MRSRVRAERDGGGDDGVGMGEYYYGAVTGQRCALG